MSRQFLEPDIACRDMAGVVGFELRNPSGRHSRPSGDRRLAREIGRMSPKVQEIAPQRFSHASLTLGNIAPVFVNRTSDPVVIEPVSTSNSLLPSSANALVKPCMPAFAAE